MEESTRLDSQMSPRLFKNSYLMHLDLENYPFSFNHLQILLSLFEIYLLGGCTIECLIFVSHCNFQNTRCSIN